MKPKEDIESRNSDDPKAALSELIDKNKAAESNNSQENKLSDKKD